MAQIVPNTIVKVLTGIPFDKSLSDVRKFNSLAEQTSYFESKVMKTFTYTDFTYQRKDMSIRVPGVADDYISANYVMYQNANFGTKWFYAFIDEIRFVNGNMTELLISTDVYQTWQFDFEVLTSFVEREHVSNDTFGANTLPEPFQVGELRLRSMGTYSPSGQGQIVIVYTLGRNQQAQPALISNVYTGFATYTASSAESATEFIREINASDDGRQIVTVYMGLVNLSGPDTASASFIFNYSSMPSVNNKKCYCYPYCQAVVTSTDGDSVTLRPERFNSASAPTGTLEGTVYFYKNTPPAISLRLNYDGQVNNQNAAVSYTSVVQANYSVDGFAQWVGQSLQGQAIKTVGSALINLATGNVVGVAHNVLSGAANLATAANAPNVPRVSSGVGTINYSTNNVGFINYAYSIDDDQVRALDDFFDRFGYRVDRIKVPNMTGRGSWNYVKTNQVALSGNVPAEDMLRIKNMFDGGVRFWHTNQIGNYALPNPIVEADHE